MNNKQQMINYLISLIPANITEEQRKHEIMWIKSGKWHIHNIEEAVKSIQPWTAKELAGVEEIENFFASI